MQQQPNREGKNDDDDESIPAPLKIMCLDRKDRDHEVVAETGITEKAAIPGKLAPDSTIQRQGT